MSSPQPGDQGPADSARSRLDRLFDEWMRTPPMRRLFGGEAPGGKHIRVDEFRDGETEVIRAELPGIDPGSDLELTVGNGMLRISAERRSAERVEEKGYTRHEMRYGSFARTLPLPMGAREDRIKAAYKDGVLEIRVPVSSEATSQAPKKIAVSRS